jgi:hypothetical protein
MEQTFGARLRAAREARQIALGDIANDTKIKVSALEAIERDEIWRLPEGLFRRAYVRAYAQAVGLDAAEIVREFLALYPAPAELSTEPDLGPPTRFGRAVKNAVAALPRRAAAQEKAEGKTEALPHEEAEAEALPHVESIAREEIVEPSYARTVAPPHQPEARKDIDLVAVADLCTRLARASDSRDVDPLLEEAATLLDAVGLIVWSWEPRLSSLQAAWAHGYSEATLARLPRVRRTADNAIASAFRSTETRVVDSTPTSTGAVVVPIATPCGCIAVLAIELRDGDEQRDVVRAVATIIAAQLAALLGATSLDQAVTA